MRMISKYYTRWSKRNKLRNELHKMTDRELRDIGIYRGNIDTVVKRSYP